jgi:hypothetical protein
MIASAVGAVDRVLAKVGKRVSSVSSWQNADVAICHFPAPYLPLGRGQLPRQSYTLKNS